MIGKAEIMKNDNTPTDENHTLFDGRKEIWGLNDKEIFIAKEVQ
ncbi:MAG: hypothetical protein ACHQD9_01750 [Chitinophagales bacterium]